MTTQRLNLLAASLSILLAVGCGGEIGGDTPPLENPAFDGRSAFGGKADGSGDVRVYKVGYGYKLVRVYGAAAKDLFDVAERAGGFRRRTRGSLTYLSGYYTICASNGDAAACNIYSRNARQASGSSAVVSGRRFSSAASELFGALARASSTNPASAAHVESAHASCDKKGNNLNVSCTIDGQARGVELTVAFEGLEKLGPGYVYEGWLITPDGPVSAGRFRDPAGNTFRADPKTAAAATLYVLTIEPAVGDDPAPSDTHVVAGAFAGNSAKLDTSHAAALGTSFASAAGSFILETPTSAAADDYDQGIWYLDPSAGPGPSLALPQLPKGWAYEGWVVIDGKPVSTGRFRSVSGADSDGAGDTAGPGGAPPFPGQDFITPAVVLSGGKAVISVEPDPDDSAAPFALKPLVGDITAAGAGASQPLSNNAAATRISGTAKLDR